MNDLFTDSKPDLYRFLDRVAECNPFDANRVTPALAGWHDAPGIFAEPFERLKAAALKVQRERLALGVLLWGEAGIGKSHLLARLERWAAAEPPPAVVVTVANLQAEPERMPRALLRHVVDMLTAGRDAYSPITPLFRMVNGMIRTALGDGHRRYTTEETAHAFDRQIGRLCREAPGRAGTFDRGVLDVLYRFFRSVALRRTQKTDDGVAPLAVQWLRGDLLDAEDARRLGLPPSADHHAVGLADDEQVKKALVALCHVALAWGRPFVLAFDQVDNLEPAQFKALARFLHALLDASINLLVVTAGVQATLFGWRQERVVQDSSWDRLAQMELELHRLSGNACLPLIGVRLQEFLKPFRDVPEVSARLAQDAYFPLGSAWAREQLEERVDVRPREAIQKARTGWEQQQTLLNGKGGAAWLEGWAAAPKPVDKKKPLSAEELQDLLDAAVLAQLTKLRQKHRAQLERLNWDPDGLADLLHVLLKDWVQREQWPLLRKVERVAVHGVQRPTLHLLLEQRLSATGPDLKRGLVCLPAGHGNSLTHHLKRLRDLDPEPDQLLLVYEERSGYTPAQTGREHSDALKIRYGAALQFAGVGLDEHAHLAALRALVAAAQGGDLEMSLPDDTTRRIERAEAVESLVRQDLFSGNLLRALLGSSVATPAEALIQ